MPGVALTFFRRISDQRSAVSDENPCVNRQSLSHPVNPLNPENPASDD